MPELLEVSHEFQRLQDADSRSVRRILDAKRLSDQPLFQVPAKPWTSVVSDNDFVSHLISLWLTWFHPFSNWVDRDRFVYDMQTGLLGAKYCSPFLVNAILAYACVCRPSSVSEATFSLIMIADILRLSRSVCCSRGCIVERCSLLR